MIIKESTKPFGKGASWQLLFSFTMKLLKTEAFATNNLAFSAETSMTISFVLQSVLQQIHNLFQIKFFICCDGVLHLSI